MGSVKYMTKLVRLGLSVGTHSPIRDDSWTGKNRILLQGMHYCEVRGSQLCERILLSGRV